MIIEVLGAFSVTMERVEEAIQDCATALERHDQELLALEIGLLYQAVVERQELVDRLLAEMNGEDWPPAADGDP